MRSFLALLLSLALVAGAAQEKLLFARHSEFAGKVLVVDDGTYRIMRFRDQGQDCEQSRCELARPDHLVLEYTRLQLLGLTFLPAPPKKILVIGLGGGSLSKALYRMYPEALVDSVEIDPVVVEAAKRFFFYKESRRVRTFTCDAVDFVKRGHERYDIIFLDAFDGLDVPEPLRTREFYLEVARLLAPDGVVVANLHRNSDTYASDRNTLDSVFKRSCAFGGLGNVLLVNTVRAGPCQLDEIKKAAAALTSEYDLVRYAEQIELEQSWDRTAPLIRAK